MRKKVVSMIALLASILCVFALCAACTPDKDPLVLKESDTFIVIKADDAAAGETLANYMTKLKENGDSAVDFEIENGMVKSINGKENASSSYWMLYTSDTENAEESWGTVEYKDKTYGSAKLGAEALKVKSGEIYIWVYQTF